ncbi:hypothetical protein SDC9_193514 [bioreactor metagenome]|uniref:FIST C-domain domain-containing protein n=1 Tax=bioreactor metagenome TaxID=1076179 RepID=A0A645I3R3_9ZZZZ
MRSINRVMDDLSLKLACSVREGMQLSVLQSSDIISDTRDKWKQIGKKYNSISTVIIANCVLRSFELNSKEQMQDYVDIFANEKLIGFCSYGEAFIGHMNHSTTFLILE